MSVAIVAPAAPAAPGDPKQGDPPSELWNAFPLNPKSERLVPQRKPKAPFTPPAKPTAVAETSSESSSGGGLPILTLAAGAGALAFLTLLVLAAGRVRRVAGRRAPSAPLWQGTAGIDSSPVARLQQYADVDVSLTQPSRFGTDSVETRPGGRGRSSRLSSLSGARAVVERLGRDIWNETTAPILVGSAIAIVTALLVIYVAV